ncbi:MAG: aldehyde ferredoxin oxidoreductase N-terminal domain-containing protein, partial [Candidatus Bathyarchaeia archaeon]
MRASGSMARGGYIGQILRINLSTRRVEAEALEDKVCFNFVGGRGFGAWWQYSELPQKVDAFSEE